MSPPSQSIEEEKDEESQFSEGQLVSTSCQSDDSEISEEIMEGKHAGSGFKLESSSLSKQMSIVSDLHCCFRTPPHSLSLCFPCDSILMFQLPQILMEPRQPKRMRAS